jgi:hypothetical protein
VYNLNVCLAEDDNIFPVWKSHWMNRTKNKRISNAFPVVRGCRPSDNVLSPSTLCMFVLSNRLSPSSTLSYYFHRVNNYVRYNNFNIITARPIDVIQATMSPYTFKTDVVVYIFKMTLMFKGNSPSTCINHENVWH